VNSYSPPEVEAASDRVNDIIPKLGLRFCDAMTLLDAIATEREARINAHHEAVVELLKKMTTETK
jgi:hypothetical protein